MSKELARPSRGREESQVAPQDIPVDCTAFNEMARYFGAAGTVMLLLETRGHATASRELIRQYIREGFWANGDQFCQEVEQIILSYYANPDNRVRSLRAIAAYHDKLARGQ